MTSSCSTGSAVLLLLAMSSSTALASSDDKFPFFAQGSGDVMRNLKNGDTYEQVYLQYNRCVWSEFGNGADEQDNSGCAGDGNEDTWYMGRTQCYRANVAYSLYGVAKGQEAPQNPCQKGNYINSFFTNQGVDYFSNSMGIDGGDASSYCEVQSGGDDDFYTNHNVVSGENNGALYPNYSSSTTSCAADGSFVQGLFTGAYCSSRKDVSALDTLDQFNDIVNSMDCITVFDAASDNGEYQYQEGANGRDLEQDNNEENNEDGLFGLLAYSDSCSILEYPSTCPDFFHIKNSLEYKPLSQESLVKKMTWMDWVGSVFLFFAVLLAMIPCCNFKDDKDSDGNPKKKRDWCGRKRNKRNNNEDGEQRRGIRGWFRRRRGN